MLLRQTHRSAPTSYFFDLIAPSPLMGEDWDESENPVCKTGLDI
jgi:hypothetical protein